MKCGEFPIPVPRRLSRCGFVLFSVFAVLIGLRIDLVAAKSSWIRVETPKFVLLAETNEKTANAWALELEQFRSVMAGVFNIEQAKLRPVTVFLFKSTRTMRSYAPEAQKNKDLAGFFTESLAHPMIVLASDSSDLGTRRTIFHETVHWYLNARRTPLPLCIEEGVAELYSTFAVKGTRFEIGQPISEHLHTLESTGLMPLDRFLAIHERSKDYNDSDRVTQFYAQAWLFCHYLFHRKDGNGAAQLTEYLRLLRERRPIVEAVRNAFKCELRELEKSLDDYARDGRYVTLGGSFERAALQKLVSIRPADTTEVEIGLGQLLVATGHGEKGEAMLSRVVQNAPQDPHGWTAMAETALMRGEQAQAADHYERAIALGSREPRAYLTVASRGQIAAAAGLSTSEARKSADLCHLALAAAEDYSDAHRLLASIAPMIDPVIPADLKALQRACALLPDDPVLVVGLASLELKSGLSAEAETRLKEILSRNNLTATERHYAETVLAGDRWRRLTEQIDRLWTKGDFKAVVTQLDVALADASYLPQQLREMTTKRTVADQMIRAENLRGLIAERRFEEAVSLGESLIAEAVPAVGKTALRQNLELARAGVDCTKAAELIARGGFDEARTLLESARARSSLPAVVKEVDRMTRLLERGEEARQRRR